MQNFGKIKNTFAEILAEGISLNDLNKKKLFKKYLKMLKESNILKTQFLVYENIEKVVEEDQFSANLIVTENLNLLNKFNKQDIINENKKLIFLLGDVELNESYDENLSLLHESISNLIFLEKTPKTVNEFSKNVKTVLNHVMSNKDKVITESYDIPNSMLSSILVEKYNEKYADISETEKNVLKLFLESTDSDDKLKTYSKIINECVDLIDIKLIESDLETKDRLLRVKDKLLRNEVKVDDDFPKNISKLVELKLSLNNKN